MECHDVDQQFSVLISRCLARELLRSAVDVVFDFSDALLAIAQASVSSRFAEKWGDAPRSWYFLIARREGPRRCSYEHVFAYKARRGPAAPRAVAFDVAVTRSAPVLRHSFRHVATSSREETDCHLSRARSALLSTHLRTCLPYDAFAKVLRPLSLRRRHRPLSGAALLAPPLSAAICDDAPPPALFRHAGRKLRYPGARGGGSTCSLLARAVEF